jgi:glutamyl-tRNA synthetase
VTDPIVADVSGVEMDMEVHLPLHPQYPEMGTRTLSLKAQNGSSKLLLSGSDRISLARSNIVRLMGLFSIRTVSLQDNALKAERLVDSVQGVSVPIVQWVPAEGNLPVAVVLPDATEAPGFAELGLTNQTVGSVVQFVRYGFCRVDELASDRAKLYFAHN